MQCSFNIADFFNVFNFTKHIKLIPLIVPPPMDPPIPEEKIPCQPNPCGINAECFPIGTGECKCVKGYFGNPYEICKPECTTNSDCPYYRACYNEKCIDPCPGTCGINAECQVVTHNPVCTCKRGFTGDPYTECRVKESKDSGRFYISTN